MSEDSINELLNKASLKYYQTYPAFLVNTPQNTLLNASQNTFLNTFQSRHENDVQYIFNQYIFDTILLNSFIPYYPKVSLKIP